MAKWTASERERRDRVRSGGTVVANLKSDANLIGWAQKHECYVKIDRRTDWGNPYILGKDGDRDTVCESYRIYILRKYSLIDRLPELQGKVLGCWCYPERCHGNELIELMNPMDVKHDPPS